MNNVLNDTIEILKKFKEIFPEPKGYCHSFTLTDENYCRFAIAIADAEDSTKLAGWKFVIGLEGYELETTEALIEYVQKLLK